MMKHAVCVNKGISIEVLQKLLNSIQVEASKTFTVFILGRICYLKNQILFKLIIEKLSDVHFLWSGDREMRNKLIASNLEITDWMDREYALSKSALADAFLLISFWKGVSISLLEVMYISITCLVSYVIGNHDVILNGENRYMCDKVSEFAKASEQIRVGNALEIIRTPYNDVLNQYNTVVMTEEYTMIYEKALGIIRGYQFTYIVLDFFDVEHIAFEKAVA